MMCCAALALDWTGESGVVGGEGGGGEVSGSPTLWVFFASPGLSLSLTLLYYVLHISLQNTSFPGVLAHLLLLAFFTLGSHCYHRTAVGRIGSSLVYLRLRFGSF
jgi:hypothetical protein